MKTIVDMTALHDQFAAGLRLARRRIRRAALAVHLNIAADVAMIAMTCVAGAFCVLRAIAVLTGSGAPVGWTAYAWVVVGVAAAILVRALVQALRYTPSLRETAERLDLGAGEHNRVAIALSLLEDEARGGFADAAMRDGLDSLHRIENERPYVEPPAPPVRRFLLTVATFIALTGVALLIDKAHAAGASHPGPDTPLATTSQPVQNRDTARPPDVIRPPQPPPRAPVRAAEGRPQRTAERAPDRRTNHERAREQEQASGQAGGGTSPEARPSDQSGATAGESAEAPTASSPPKPEAGRRPKNAKPRTPGESGTRRPDAATEASAISQGASGGGTLSPVQNAWSQHARTIEAGNDDEEADEPVEDEADSNQQRGGVQPSLKDRNEAPTRELGISGEEGPPGTGRGGPTPPKKSRGTASLVLGVPVPDFVKGRLGPGTTKITHERVDPTPMPGDAPAPAAAAERSLPETPCSRFDVPAAFAELVRAYMVSLHSADRRVPANADASAPARKTSAEE